MIRKKKGSTLVTTIIIFGALLVTGTAILAMSVGDYKMRLSQNKRIENLYGSESGLDVAYDIMVKDFDSAAQFGAFRAKQLEVKDANNDSIYKPLYVEQQVKLKELEEYNSKNPEHPKSPEQIESDRKAIYKEMDALKNKEFKRSFKTFLYVPEASHDDADSDTKDYRTPDQLKGSLQGTNDGITRNYISGLEDKERELNADITNHDDFEWSHVDLVSNEGESDPQIRVDIPIHPDINANEDSDNQKYEIRINSEFKTVEGNTVVKGKTQIVNGEHRREVQAIYNLTVPNYKDVVFGESQIKERNIYKDKGITIGGDMEVGDTTSVANVDLTVNGDVFVEGKSEGTNLSSKYKGGISLNNVEKVNFNGNVVTGKTFNVGKNVDDATISENLYAGNVYAGDKDDLTKCGEDCTLNVIKDMVLDNDLTLKAINTSITTKNFYGINDKKIEDSEDSKTDKVKNSSSIIVNKYTDNDQKPAIAISNEALIMGVAYINTGSDNGGYATGESIGVKGNYNAYSEHVDSDNENNNNLEFDNEQDGYHDAQSPLYLVDGNVVQNVVKKDKHFTDYWNGKSGLVDAGGVHFDDINKIFSTGAIVYKENGSKVQTAKGPIESLQSKAILKQKEYALREYKMDMKEISGNLDDSLNNLYDNPPTNIVDKLMKFPSTNENDKFIDGEAIKIGDEDSKFGLFNPTENGNIIIKESTKTNVDLNDPSNIIITVKTGETLNAFIATAGNVTISGQVKIKGNIIAKGNLKIEGSGEKIITYDKELAESLQAKDADIFKQVFGSGDVNPEIKPGDKTEIVVQYDLTKFLKNLLWKLIK